MKKLLQGLLFILVGIPGLLLFLYSTLALVVELGAPRHRQPELIAISAVLLPIGAFFLLVGVGKLRQWLYILVFMSFPISLGIFGKISLLIGYRDKGAQWIIASGVIACVVYVFVKRYYDQRSQSRDGTETRPKEGAMD
jgi:hypothetical protein